MDISKIKVVAMDLDGTLTQHKQPMIPEVREARRGGLWVYLYAFLLFMLLCGLKYEAHFAKFFQD